MLVRKTRPILCVEMNFQWLDVGNITDIWSVTKDILDGKIPGYPIPGTQVRAGVWVGINSVVDLNNCSLTPPVVIGSGCLKSTRMRGNWPSVSGANCQLDSGSVVEESLIFDNINVESGAHIKHQTIFGNYCIGHDSVQNHDLKWHNPKNACSTQPCIGYD